MPAKKKAVKKAGAVKTAKAGSKYDNAWKGIDAVASLAGAPGAIGAKAARGLASIFGYGAYKTRRSPVKRLKGSRPMRNTIRGMGDYSSSGTPGAGGLGVPQFTNTAAEKNGNIRFAHREYLQDIQSSTTFVNLPYAIQPGLASSFPFLSAIASNFEQYKFHGLVYYFRTMSGTAVGSTSTALGTVVMAVQYDSISPPFTTKSEMENYVFAVSGVPCYDLQHMVECAPKETPINVQYVRTGGVPAGADERMYDLGTFNIATAGMQAASNNTVGELWVSYDIELIKSRVPSGAGLSLALTDHFQGNVASLSTANLLGTTVTTPVASSTIQGSWNPTTNTYTFPVNFTDGIFMMVYQCTGAATAMTGLGASFGTNIGAQAFWQNDTASSRGLQGAGSTSATQLWVFTFKFNGGVTPNQSFITISGPVPTTPTGADLFVTTMTPALVGLFESKIPRREKILAETIRDEILSELKEKYTLVERKESKEDPEAEGLGLDDITREIASLTAKKQAYLVSQKYEVVSEPSTPAESKKAMSRKG